MRVRWAKGAIADLVDIRNHIALDKPAVASRLAIELIALGDNLEAFPARGRPGLVPGTRELVSGRLLIIVYRTSGSQTEILRVIHGARKRP